ncbi:YjbE family putative metal transport protein [Ahrensia sp. R2A130]|uniref:YjbE family putative metal transport protein n=1 Tax=Ahrensia sp. R2A130 TaxID=744979 RepID=UPI0001E0B4E6|nr:YjbE family putative metal transport protein [Ahrensia sp. R2A130]EFL88736.1 integral membrane protein TerC [Ahrensia sp. R2A130]
MWDLVSDYGRIIVADLVLSGDNALIIGMAAAGLAPELRKKAILFGMVVAAVLRIIFALVATKMLAIPGLLFVGGLLLCWVCWTLYKEIRESLDAKAEEALITAENPEAGYTGAPRRSLLSALWTITVADVSMSIDNVLAVAAIADGDSTKLVVGLAIAIIAMAFFATLIMKLLTKYPVISWVGLVVLIWVAGEMLYKGIFDPGRGLLAYINGTGIVG